RRRPLGRAPDAVINAVGTGSMRVGLVVDIQRTGAAGDGQDPAIVVQVLRGGRDIYLAGCIVAVVEGLDGRALKCDGGRAVVAGIERQAGEVGIGDGAGALTAVEWVGDRARHLVVGDGVLRGGAKEAAGAGGIGLVVEGQRGAAAAAIERERVVEGI